MMSLDAPSLEDHCTAAQSTPSGIVQALPGGASASVRLVIADDAYALSWTPDLDRYLSRIRRLADSAANEQLDAVVLVPGPDLLYYAGRDQGSYERLTALVIRPGRDPLLVVPALEAPGWAQTPLAGALEVTAWSDGEDPYALIARTLPRVAKVAVDDHVPALHLLKLNAALEPSQVRLASVLTAPQRRIKEPEELAALAAVGRANDRVQQAVSQWLRPGRTEAEVASDIAAALVHEGHAHADFVIVASGAHGASPHHGCSDTVILDGDPVVIDIGGPAPSRYNSDSTRTYCLGTPRDPDFADVHALVVAAQEAGFQAAVEGASCASVDAAARRVIADAGLSEHFITRTGHGIGLEVHEEPYLVTGNDQPLLPGMVFSIEPGVYLPGRFGVRIEDIVAIDQSGRPMRLNASPKTWTLS